MDEAEAVPETDVEGDGKKEPTQTAEGASKTFAADVANSLGKGRLIEGLGERIGHTVDLEHGEDFLAFVAPENGTHDVGVEAFLQVGSERAGWEVWLHRR